MHVNKTDPGYKHLNADMKKSKDTSASLEVLTFDMQQRLPVPQLSHSQGFYQRQLWVYYVCSCVLHREVASAILKVLNELRKKKILPVNELILWSDGCTGQNKNFIVALWSYAIQREDWIRLAESARHKKPFAVLPMKRLEVVDLASFIDEMFCRPHASAGLKMRQATEICIDKDNPFVVQYKYTPGNVYFIQYSKNWKPSYTSTSCL
ncbi:hypothetical protein PR048_014346 [Dryococelus australis]|uniref:Uncharacterized protein n=1 Tax=Dryococelus australis TaxID=614101 RepID=A0ABQ9HE61_9NEOP|nr:hypothetical protein PR048_014346 [Dryococelus australis]